MRLKRTYDAVNEQQNQCRYTRDLLHRRCNAAHSNMKFLVKKYLSLGMIIGVLVAPLETIYATETPPIISKILSTASQEGYPKAIQILNKEFEKHRGLKFELLVIKAEFNFKSQKHNEAIEIYKSLIKDHPHNLLLHNNLAVIQADQGNLEAAELTLLEGIKQQSDFDVAYKNLMKLKGKQASLALQSALSPSTLASKNIELISLNQITNEINLAGPNKVLTENKSSTHISQEKSIIVAATTADHKSQPTHIASNVEKMSQQPEPIINTQDRSNILGDKSLGNESLNNPPPETNSDISKQLGAWALEWSKGNVEGYLSFYSTSFNPEGDVSLEKWKSQRRQRITPNQEINVQLENIETNNIKPNLIEASFKQIYTSRSIKARANKKITFEKHNNQWRIIREEIVK